MLLRVRYSIAAASCFSSLSIALFLRHADGKSRPNTAEVEGISAAGLKQGHAWW